MLLSDAQMEAVLRFLNANKTKLSGALLSLLAFLQANGDLVTTLFGPKAFAWIVFASGAVFTVYGFLNNPK